MHVCPYTSVWLLVISVCVYCKLLQSLSRSRQCEGKACCFCPQTLVGARRFHSPCRRCAGSAGVHKGKLSKHHLCTHTPHFHHSQRSINLSLDANWNSVAHYLRVYLLVICLKKKKKNCKKTPRQEVLRCCHSHIGTAHRWGRRPVWLPRGYPECLHWLHAQAAASPALWNSNLGNTLKTR